MARRLTIPGFVNAHSHAFQRALRGRTEGGDFWAWREAMLTLADEQTSERVRTGYEDVYREMLAAGYTAVGEFHYLGFEQALAAAEAADAAGIELVLLAVAYARGGLERFRQPSPADYLNQVERFRERGIRVGVAPHSVRACPPDWLEEIGRYAAEHDLHLHVHADEQPREIDECIEEHGVRPIELLAKTGCLGPRTTVVHATHADDWELDLLAEAGARICACPPDWLEEIGRYAAEHDLPLHVHADEQPREIDECIEEHGVRPIELLARTGCLGPRTTVVHATHADDGELDLLAEAGARICACLTTEANLGDGFLPVERICERGIGLTIGSDSNVRIDPLEELRELEGIARRRALRRNVVSPKSLLSFGADEGAASLGLDAWPDAEVDLDHPSLAGIDEADVLGALVFGCSADVFV